jgi:hypothetical protein
VAVIVKGHLWPFGWWLFSLLVASILPAGFSGAQKAVGYANRGFGDCDCHRYNFVAVSTVGCIVVFGKADFNPTADHFYFFRHCGFCIVVSVFGWGS